MTLHLAKRFEWERIVRRVVMPAATKLVAFTLAQYGSQNGDAIHPGFERLAAVCGMGHSTVRRHVDALLALGLVERVSNGGGPNKLAARYRLTIPEDLLERVQMLDPDERTPLATVSAVEAFLTDPTPLTRGSGDPDIHTPVEAEISARPGERSLESNSAHLEPELRSFRDRTPLTQMSAHHPYTPPLEHHPPTALKVTSPGPPLAASRPIPAPADWRTRP